MPAIETAAPATSVPGALIFTLDSVRERDFAEAVALMPSTVLWLQSLRRTSDGFWQARLSSSETRLRLQQRSLSDLRVLVVSLTENTVQPQRTLRHFDSQLCRIEALFNAAEKCPAAA